MSFCLMLARNRFHHLVDDVLWYACHVSIRRSFKSPVTAAGITDRCLYNVHTFLHQSTNYVVNRTVWRTQIWRDKVRCFLPKELDCFTSTYCRTRHFRRSCLTANKVSKSEGMESWTHISFLKVYLRCLPKKNIKISPCLSKQQLVKVGAFFWDTVYNSSATASAVYPKSFTTMAATFYPNVANKYTCCKQRSLSPEPGNSTVDDILRNVLEDNPVEISPPQITPLRYPPRKRRK